MLVGALWKQSSLLAHYKGVWGSFESRVPRPHIAVVVGGPYEAEYLHITDAVGASLKAEYLGYIYVRNTTRGLLKKGRGKCPTRLHLYAPLTQAGISCSRHQQARSQDSRFAGLQYTF